MTLAVLSVEDEAVNRALLRAVFARDDRLRTARLVEATSLAAARQALTRDRFDLVILDLRLPDGDGLSLTDELQALPDAPAVLVLSANVQEEWRRAAAAAGVQGFIGKPYRRDELVAEIERVVGLVKQD